MTFNQFSKFGTPIHKKQNLNLKLEEGQLEFPIHQFLKFGSPINLNNGQLEFPIHDI